MGDAAADHPADCANGIADRGHTRRRAHRGRDGALDPDRTRQYVVQRQPDQGQTGRVAVVRIPAHPTLAARLDRTRVDRSVRAPRHRVGAVHRGASHRRTRTGPHQPLPSYPPRTKGTRLSIADTLDALPTSRTRVARVASTLVAEDVSAWFGE